MKDEAYVAELQAILTNQHPRGIDPRDPYMQADNGIDRYDGFGRDVWVDSVQVVEGAHGSELEVTFGLTVPPDSTFASAPRQGVVRVPFQREWRHLSGYEAPAGYAPRVARSVEIAACDLVARATDEWSVARPRVRGQLPDQHQQWRMLLDALAAEGTVAVTSPGRITVSLESDRVEPGAPRGVTVLVTPDEWEQVLVEGAGEYGDIWELFATRSLDEIYLVFYDRDLVWSIREQLPPVHGAAIAEVARRVAGRSRRP